MNNTESQDFIRTAKYAPIQNKRDRILQEVTDKTVLDLGIIDHDLENSLQNRNRWLHGAIVERAKRVVGVDILGDDIDQLRGLGFDAVKGDATQIRLDEKFEVVVCGDLIEHVASPLALLETISFHLEPQGKALISTPNPFSIGRALNVVVEGWTGINPEHVCWICPQTMFQLVNRTDLKVNDFAWLLTDYPTTVTRRGFSRISRYIQSVLSNRNHMLKDDFMVVLGKKNNF